MDVVLPWKSVWITGAGKGIGAALARLFSKKGATVYISSRTPADLAQVKDSCRDYPGIVVPIPLDITEPEQIEYLVQAWEAGEGIPQLVILNAGTHTPCAVSEFSAEHCKHLLDVNLQGTLNCLAPVLQRYIRSNDGQVAVMGSVAGYRGLPTAAAYGASKAALINLCESLYLDLSALRVKIQLINPGFVRTPLTDKNAFEMPFLIEPEEAAERILIGLCSDKFEITFPRRFSYLLKLLRLLPYRWYFRILARKNMVKNVQGEEGSKMGTKEFKS